MSVLLSPQDGRGPCIAGRINKYQAVTNITPNSAKLTTKSADS